MRPKMSGIFEPELFARDRKSLTGTAGCPDGTVEGPVGKSQGEVPSRDPGKQMDPVKAA